MMLFCGLLLIAGGAANQAVAQGDVLPIAQMEYQGIPYASGGVGLDERENLAAMSRNYSLKLVFAATSGKYTADVKVAIANSRGKEVLNAVSDGPWFFCNLPPGRYTVTATMLGKEKRNRVSIGKGQRQRTLSFSWNESDFL